MTPYDLDKRVTIQQRGMGKDSTGAIVEGWQNLITAGDGKVWARVRDMTGRQFMASTATQNEVTTEIRVRRRPGIAPKMRVLFGTDVYDIDAVLVRDARWIDLMCVRGLSGG